ncbi:hypothetical protein Tco_0754033 [Tanacetum coccineum]
MPRDTSQNVMPKESGAIGVFGDVAVLFPNDIRIMTPRYYDSDTLRVLRHPQRTVEGHSILSLEDSLSGDCDVEKNGKWSYIYAVGSQEYQMVCTRLDIASADVGSLKANLQHMEALSTTEAGYMTFTEAWKKEIWLKGLLTESRYELRLVAGIATGALVKGGSRSEVPAQVEVAAYRPYTNTSIWAPIAGTKPHDTTDANYKLQEEKAHSTILLCLSDEVLYEVGDEETEKGEHLDALNSILMDLKNVEVKIEDEDAALVLLVSLPHSFESFVSSFVVGHWKIDCPKLKKKAFVAATAKRRTDLLGFQNVILLLNS